MIRHRDPCVTTVYDLILEVDVVQWPRFWAKFPLVLLQQHMYLWILGAVHYLIPSCWLDICFDAFSV